MRFLSTAGKYVIVWRVKKKININQQYKPKRCWVGEKQKICYPDEESAELAARYVEQCHGLPGNSLKAYKCSYGEHWHLANKK